MNISTDIQTISREQIRDVGEKYNYKRLEEKVSILGETVSPPSNFYTKYGKRFIDIVVSFAVLLFTAPINFVLAIVTYFDVGKPLLFHQKRAGRCGREFVITKFRNMTNETDQNGILLPASMRVTETGKFIRRSSLDELLNFWSILKGDMSIIGPRPLPCSYVERYSPRHLSRLSVRPGLECPPRKEISNSKWTWNDQFENDVWYVENLSLRTDLLLIFQLIKLVFDPKRSASRGNAERRSFIGYDAEGAAIGLHDISEEEIKAAVEKTSQE